MPIPLGEASQEDREVDLERDLLQDRSFEVILKALFDGGPSSALHRARVHDVEMDR